RRLPPPRSRAGARRRDQPPAASRARARRGIARPFVTHAPIPPGKHPRRRAKENLMSPETRLKLGVALLIVGLVMPAGPLAAAATAWPLAVKTVLSSILLFGFEIMIIPAVALMGKDNFDRIWAGAMRHLKTLKPAGGVSKRRYTIGLYMLVVPILYAW